MSSKSKGAREGGIGFLGALTIVFIVLKLVGTIDWSWWWVLAPLWAWIPICAVFLALYWGAVFVYEKITK